MQAIKHQNAHREQLSVEISVALSEAVPEPVVAFIERSNDVDWTHSALMCNSLCAYTTSVQAIVLHEKLENTLR